MSRFFSSYAVNVDDKSRVSVPPRFKQALKAQESKEICLFENPTSNAIEGCGSAYWEFMNEEIEKLERYGEEREFWEAILATASISRFNESDTRILLPEDLKLHAGIVDSAVFAGRGTTFEIWNPDAFQSARTEARSWGRANRPTLSGFTVGAKSLSRWSASQ